LEGDTQALLVRADQEPAELSERGRIEDDDLAEFEGLFGSVLVEGLEGLGGAGLRRGTPPSPTSRRHVGCTTEHGLEAEGPEERGHPLGVAPCIVERIDRDWERHIFAE